MNLAIVTDKYVEVHRVEHFQNRKMGFIMGLLESLVKEGWWDSSRRPEVSIDISSIDSEKIYELLKTRSTVIFDKASAKTYAIHIPTGVAAEDLRDDDFFLMELPG